jgi:hypothetical protein
LIKSENTYAEKLTVRFSAEAAEREEDSDEDCRRNLSNRRRKLGRLLDTGSEIETLFPPTMNAGKLMMSIISV